MGKHWRQVKDFFKADGGAEVIGTARVHSPYDQNTREIKIEGTLDPAKVREAIREMEEPSVAAIRDGWNHARGLGHMCLPPDVYPDGWGPGSMYGCPECGCPWQAKGVRQVGETYKWYGFGSKMLFGPKQWIYAGSPASTYRDNDGSPICPIPTQQGFYDWRDPSEPLFEIQNRIATLLHDIHALAHILHNPVIVEHREPGKVDWANYNPAPGGSGPYGRHSVPSEAPEARSARSAARREDVEGG